MEAPRSVPAVLAAILASAIVAFASCARAESSSGPASAKASIDFRIVIPVVLRIRTLHQAPSVSIAASDVAKGYVDIPGGTRIAVTTNNPAGFAVSLDFDRALVARVEARIAGRSMQAASAAAKASIPVAKLVEAPIEVAYRLYLAPGVRPGTYRWPVAISFAARG